MEKEVSNKLDGEEVGQVKMSKIEKFFTSQKEKFNKHIVGFENRIVDKVNKFVNDFNSQQQNFINTVNTNVDKIDKKYGGMYNMLVRKFLVELENRIYTSELSNKTMLVIFSEKFHKIESDLNKIQADLLKIQPSQDGSKPECLGTILSLKDYLKDMENSYAIKMKDIHDETQKANEVENVQSVQEETKTETVPNKE